MRGSIHPTMGSVDTSRLQGRRDEMTDSPHSGQGGLAHMSVVNREVAETAWTALAIEAGQAGDWARARIRREDLGIDPGRPKSRACAQTPAGPVLIMQIELCMYWILWGRRTRLKGLGIYCVQSSKDTRTASVDCYIPHHLSPGDRRCAAS